MHYFVDLYKSNSEIDSIAIDKLNGLIINNSNKEDWKGWEADKWLEDFDSEKVRREIEGWHAGNELVKVYSWHTPLLHKVIVTVDLAYDSVRKFVPLLSALAIENGLKLLDRQTENCFSAGTLWNEDLVCCRSRALQLKKELQRDFLLCAPIRKIEDRKSSEFIEHPGHIISYVLTVPPMTTDAFIRQTEELYARLRNFVTEGEMLSYQDGYFSISSKRGRYFSYAINLVLEKMAEGNACIGGIEETPTRHGIELIRERRNCEKVLSGSAYPVNYHKLPYSQWSLWDKMGLAEMTREYTNPADRFVAGADMAKRLSDGKLPMYVEANVYCGAEFIFHRVDIERGSFVRSPSISVLKMSEETASFLLPIIKDFYPYIYDRYYLDENYLPVQMWIDIEKRIHEVVAWINQEPVDYKILPYLKYFDLYKLADEGEWGLLRTAMTSEKLELLHRNRAELTKFYENFCWWLERQLSLSSDGLINVEGP